MEAVRAVVEERQVRHDEAVAAAKAALACPKLATRLSKGEKRNRKRLAEVGTVCDLHHGLANALMIDTVLAWNVRAAPEKFEEPGATEQSPAPKKRGFFAALRRG